MRKGYCAAIACVALAAAIAPADAAGLSGRAYRQGDGIALEAQNFPNAVNQPNFPSPRLDPGQEYRARIVLRLSVAR